MVIHEAVTGLHWAASLHEPLFPYFPNCHFGSKSPFHTNDIGNVETHPYSPCELAKGISHVIWVLVVKGVDAVLSDLIRQ